MWLLLPIATALAWADPQADPQVDLRLAAHVGDLYLADTALADGADPQLALADVLIACDGPMAEVLVWSGARPEGAEARRPLQCGPEVSRDLAAVDAAWGRALLREAAREGRGELVGWLLDDGVAPGGDALQAAIARRQRAVVDRLLKAGAPVSADAIASAARDSDLELLDRLTRGLSRDALGEALVACSGTHRAVVERLLRKGAPVAHVHGTRGPPLVEAAAAGQLEVVDALLAAGASVGTPRHDGRTALMVAGRSPQVVARLLKAGADPLAQLPTGWTVLHAAARQSADSVDLLLAAGADPSAAMASSGETPLHQAARTGQAEVVRRLLAAGADPQAQSVYPGGSDRAVDLARQAGHADVVDVLVAFEATELQAPRQ